MPSVSSTMRWNRSRAEGWGCAGALLGAMGGEPEGPGAVSSASDAGPAHAGRSCPRERGMLQIRGEEEDKGFEVGDGM